LFLETKVDPSNDKSQSVQFSHSLKEPQLNFQNVQNRKYFLIHRKEIAKKLFIEFNERIFEGRLPQLELIWSNAMTNASGKYCSELVCPFQIHRKYETKSRHSTQCMLSICSYFHWDHFSLIGRNRKASVIFEIIIKIFDYL
jgi:hypothetical protein